LNYFLAMTQQVLQSFLSQSSLESTIEHYGTIVTKEITVNLNLFLASELKRIAKSRKRKANELCDVGVRTLDKWFEKGKLKN